MLPIREQYDADLGRSFSPTEYMADENNFPMPCSICGNEYYVDEATLHGRRNAAEYGSENTFVCLACDEAYEDAAHR